MAKLPKSQKKITNAEHLANQERAARIELVQNAISLRRVMMEQLIDPKRDIDKECGYPVIVTPEMFRGFWRRNGIARRVVSIEPWECWKVTPEVYEIEDEGEDTEFEKAWKSLEKKQNIYHYLERVDVLSGLGHYGILLIGLSDGAELDQPVAGIDETGKTKREPKPKPEKTPKPKPTPGLKLKTPPAEPLEPDPMPEAPEREPEEEFAPEVEVIYLRAFDETLAPIAETDQDPASPRYGQPTFYNLNFADPRVLASVPNPGAGTNMQSKRVHWTRVLHVADNRTTSEVFGTPRMEDVFNYLYELKKVLSGSGEMFWKGGYPGYSFEISPEAAADGVTIDKEATRKEMEDFSNSLQRYMALIGVSAKSLAPQVADPTQHILVQIEAICIAKAYPKHIFMGSSQGKLASAGEDADQWDDRLRRRQMRYISPMLLAPMVQRLMDVGALPLIEEPIIDWLDISSPSDDEVATTALKVTECMAKFTGSDVQSLCPPKEFFIHVLKWSSEQADAVLKAAENFIAENPDLDPSNPAHPEHPENPANIARQEKELQMVDAQAQAKAKAAPPILKTKKA